MDENKKDFLKKNLIKLISLWKTSGFPQAFPQLTQLTPWKN
jgi:hypothetical protein